MAGPKGPVLDITEDQDEALLTQEREENLDREFPDIEIEGEPVRVDALDTIFVDASEPASEFRINAQTITATGASLDDISPVEIFIRGDERDPLISNPDSVLQNNIQLAIDAGLAGSYSGIAGIAQAKLEQEEKEKEKDDELDMFLDILDQIAAIDAKINDMQSILDRIEEKETLQAKLELNVKALAVAEIKRDELEDQLSKNTVKLQAVEKKHDDMVADAENAGVMTLMDGNVKGIVCTGKNGQCVLATKNGTKELNDAQQREVHRRGGTENVASPEQLAKFEELQNQFKEIQQQRGELTKDIETANSNIAALRNEQTDLKNDIERVDQQLDELKSKHGLQNKSDEELKKICPEEIARLIDQKTALQEKIGIKDQSIKSLSDYTLQVDTVSKRLNKISSTPVADGGANLTAKEANALTAQLSAIKTQFATLTETKTTTTNTLEANNSQIAIIDESITARTLTALGSYNEGMSAYRETQANAALVNKQITELKTQRDVLNSSKDAMAAISKMGGEVQSAIGDFPGTRKEYIEKAYGGAIAFHWMNAKSLLPGGAQPPLVKTDAGDIVYKDEKGLFTMKMDKNGELFKDATGQPIRQDITDPLEIAKLEHQGWVGSPPKLFGNERPSSVMSALGDLGSYLTKADDKKFSAMRVQDSAATIDTQIKSIDTQLTGISTQFDAMNNDLKTLDLKMQDLNKELSISKRKIEDSEREVITSIETGMMKDADIEKIRENSTDDFKEKIDSAIEYRNEMAYELYGIWPDDAKTDTSTDAPIGPKPDAGQILADENKAAIAAAIIEKGGMTEDELKLVAEQYGITDPAHFEILKKELAAQPGIEFKEKPPQYSADGVIMFGSTLKESQQPSNVVAFTPDKQTADLVAQAARVAVMNGPQPIIAPSPMAV